MILDLEKVLLLRNLDTQFLMLIKKYLSYTKKKKKFLLNLKKNFQNIYFSFPIKKKEISKAILANNSNLKKIVKIVHPEIRRKMKFFIKKNKNKKLVILDIPLLLENKINNKRDVLIFVQATKKILLKDYKKEKISILNC